MLDDPDSVTLPLPEALPVILSVPLKETLEVSEREIVPLVEGVWLSAGVEVAVAEKDSLTLCEPEGVIENDEEWLEEEVSERELLSPAHQAPRLHLLRAVLFRKPLPPAIPHHSR